MIATDFIFDGQRASDFNLAICSFDGELQPATGGEAEFDVVKAPDNDRFTFYGAQYNTPLEWNFSVIKNPCKNNSGTEYFSTNEERSIYKWLERRDGYYWFSFCQDEDEDSVWYNVKIQITPQYSCKKVIGFDLVVTADSAFGFTSIQKKKAVMSKYKPFIIYIDTDTNNYLLPEINITGSGDFYISNDSDPERNVELGKESSFKNVTTTIFMDSENMFIDGISFDNFNCRFLRLVNGRNVITTNSEKDIIIEIFYREVRRVVI